MITWANKFLFYRPSAKRNSSSDEKSYYRDLITAGYDNSKENEILQKHGFTKDTALSTNKDKVYVNPNGRAYVIYKGTNPFDINDLKTDGALLFGLHKNTSRFQDARKLAKEVKLKYGDDSVAVGHSLGGALAEDSGLNTRITYNKGVGFGDIGKQIRRGQHDYRTSEDIISVLSTTQKYGNRAKSDSGARYQEMRTYQDPVSSHLVYFLK